MSPPGKRPSGEHQAPSGLSPLDSAPVTGSDLKPIYDALTEIRDCMSELKTSVDANQERLVDTLAEHQECISGTSLDNPGLQIRVDRIEQKEKRIRSGIWLLWAAVGIVSAGVTIFHYVKRDVTGPNTTTATVRAGDHELLGRQEPANHDND